MRTIIFLKNIGRDEGHSGLNKTSPSPKDGYPLSCGLAGGVCHYGVPLSTHC